MYIESSYLASILALSITIFLIVLFFLTGAISNNIHQVRMNIYYIFLTIKLIKYANVLTTEVVPSPTSSSCN